MSTYQLAPEGGPAPGWARTTRARARQALAAARPPELLLGALLLLVLYAAFAHGATDEPAEPRLQVALAAVAAVAGAIWIWQPRQRFASIARPTRLALAGVGLLVAFTIWSGVTLAWSVSPTGTWLELNRYIAYSLVLALAVLAGSSAPRARELLHAGFVAVALLVTAYALGQKLLPDLHIFSLFNLNQTGQIPRLQMPFGYWNALGLFLAMGVPLVLVICVDTRRSWELRIGAVVTLELIFIAIAFTYSRGALVALVAAIVVCLAFTRQRLRGLLWLAAAGLAAAVPLVVGLSSHALTTPRVGLSQRQTTGAEFAAVIVVSVLALVIGARQVLRLEERVTITPVRARAITRGLLALVGVVVFIGLVGITLSHRGLTGEISHEWHNFTDTQALSVTSPNRLLSDKFGYRLLWWKEAVRAFSDKPVGGWGAGSFPVIHLLFRRNALSVQQPHSVPLQFLAETGLIGALLAIGAFTALLVAAVGAVRRSSSRDRLIAAALLGSAAAYLLHACFDWDSDIPGVTLPMLVFVGVLVGSARAAGPTSAQPATLTPDAVHGYLPSGPGARTVGAGPATRIVAIVALTVALCAVGLSAALPSLAGDKVSSAELLAAGGTTRDLVRADQQAGLATRLNPLSDAGLLLQATIALRLAEAPGNAAQAAHQVQRARKLIGQALARNPSDIKAWTKLAQIELLSHHLKAGIAAAQHMLDLDPEDEANLLYAAGLAQGASVLVAPPSASPAAVQTPESPASPTTGQPATG